MSILLTLIPERLSTLYTALSKELIQLGSVRFMRALQAFLWKPEATFGKTGKNRTQLEEKIGKRKWTPIEKMDTDHSFYIFVATILAHRQG